MNVLEKILKEIKEVEKKFVVGHEVLFALGATAMTAEIEEIIRSHMEDATISKTESVRNDGWIPVEERMPKELERVIAWDRYRKRTIIVRYACGAFVYNYYTEPLDIIAWQPLPEPYIKNPK